MSEQSSIDRRKRRVRAFALLALLALGLLFGLRLARRGPGIGLRNRLRALYTRLTTKEECVEGPRGVSICVASSMAKLPNHGPVPREPWLFDAARQTIRLAAARNEVVAFQLILKGNRVSPPARVTVEIDDMRDAAGHVLRANPFITRYLANYVWVEPGGYTWGPPSQVLPWPDFYPDALVPFSTECRVGRGTLPVINTFAVPPASGQNQAVWIDIYVPRDLPVGHYQGRVRVSIDGRALQLPLALEAQRPVLPDRPTVQAVGELYDPYELEGVGEDVADPRWQRMAQCYQQLAHRHRLVFLERFVADGTGEGEAAWKSYDEAFGPALSGELFSERFGYVGAGAAVPVTVWRTPWAQPYNERLRGPLEGAQVAKYEQLAREFSTHLGHKGWPRPYLFAYVFDEVVGPADSVASAARQQDLRHSYVRMVHGELQRVQRAIDRGAQPTRIDLLWTSHVPPSIWRGQAGLDLTGTVRLWSPNAGAAEPAFLQARAAAGDHVWFYHDGHPSVGVHAINASGIEMRTWGVITARYRFNGHLMWAVNFGNPEAPYSKPTFKNDDDRFGNGTMVYPGKRLPDIGLPAIDEPVPSMRLKAWREGLQDAELVAMARRAGRGDKVDRLLRQLVPRALAEGRGGASWPQDSTSWHLFHTELLRLAASP